MFRGLILDEDDRRCATAEGLEPEGPRSCVAIEHVDLLPAGSLLGQH